MQIVIALVLGVLTSLTGWAAYTQNTQNSDPVGGALFAFTSQQLAPNPQANYILQTDGTTNSWVVNAGGGGGGGIFSTTTAGLAFTNSWDTVLIGGSASSTNAQLEVVGEIAAAYLTATSTTPSTFTGGFVSQASSTFTSTTAFQATSTWASGIHPIMHGIYALDSAGLHLHSNNGTEVAYFGAGGGANITFPGYTSALLQTGASGAVSEYAGTSCTNQFIRSLSALGIATCASVAATDIADGDHGDFTYTTNVASLDANVVQDNEIDYTAVTLSDFTNDASFITLSSLSATYPIAYNSGTGAFTWAGIATSSAIAANEILFATGANTFAGTTSISAAFIADAFLLNTGDVGTGVFDFGGATSFEIPNGTGPTVDATGEVAWDTTSGQLKVYDGSTVNVFMDEWSWGTTLASSSLAYDGSYGAAGTTTVEKAGFKYASTITEIYCETDTGTTSLRVGDGTNWSEFLTCGTGGDTQSSPSNGSFTAREGIQIQIGTQSGNPNKILLDVTTRWTAD